MNFIIDKYPGSERGVVRRWFQSITERLNIRTHTVASLKDYLAAPAATSVVLTGRVAKEDFIEGATFRVRAWGVTAANANNKSVAVTWTNRGGTFYLAQSTPAAINNGKFVLDVSISRLTGILNVTGGGIFSTSTGINEVMASGFPTSTINDFTDISIEATGVASGDIIFYGATIQFIEES